jgi:hypothetical protein
MTTTAVDLLDSLRLRAHMAAFDLPALWSVHVVRVLQGAERDRTTRPPRIPRDRLRTAGLGRHPHRGHRRSMAGAQQGTACTCR